MISNIELLLSMVILRKTFLNFDHKYFNADFRNIDICHYYNSVKIQKEKRKSHGILTKTYTVQFVSVSLHFLKNKTEKNKSWKKTIYNVRSFSYLNHFRYVSWLYRRQWLRYKFSKFDWTSFVKFFFGLRKIWKFDIISKYALNRNKVKR